jgi:hypothetical protein
MMLWYRPETAIDLRTLIRDLPDDMQVVASGDSGLTVSTVGELRKLKVWPKELIIVNPRFAERSGMLKVERAA